MSHGHEHKDYTRVFGNVEKRSKGLIVLCDGESPKSGSDVYQQSRAICLALPLPACKTCEHGAFSVALKPGAGNQLVACPRWDSLSDRLERTRPQYEMVRRQQCLIDRPYEHCSFCPNKDIGNPPRVDPGWWEAEKWKEH